MELNRLVAQATIPGKGDSATAAKALVSVLQSGDTSTEARKYIIRALARLGAAEATAPLVKLLTGNDPLLQEEARQALSAIHSHEAVAAIETALKTSSDKRAKLGLLDALADRKSASSLPAIAPLILDADLEIAAAAISAAGRIGGPDAVILLSKANASNKLAPDLKHGVESALILAGSGDPKLTRDIYHSTDSDIVRLAAFIAITRAPEATGNSSIIESALKSPEPSLRHAALVKGIESNLPSLLSSLAGSMEQMPKEDRLVVLANIHLAQAAQDAEKIALARLSSTEEDERISAISALGKIGSKPAFDAVVQSLGAREPRVNQAAANALATTTYPQAESELLALLKGDGGPNKLLAIKAMLSRQIPDGNSILIQIIQGSDAEASKEAQKTLYFTASMDDLRALCAAAATAGDEGIRRSLVSISTRIASRINTDEARDLVKELD
jgi:HEAT repeat protein